MDKEYIKKLAENPDFIPGIYNYCDRWCERCSFTRCCMNFALCEEQFSDPQTHDIKNKAFWEHLSEIFQLTYQMVKETATEQGIDLDSLNVEAEKNEHEKLSNIAKNHECCQEAKVYGQMVEDWFNSTKELFDEKAEELGLQVQLELPDSNPVQEADDLEDSVDIIRWYQHFIFVKLLRAVRGKLEETYRSPDTVPNDSNGSAKVALIAIDRSIAAWGQMSEHFQQHKDDILDILVHLDRLRKKTQTTFPKAMEFVRPGFDY